MIIRAQVKFSAQGTAFTPSQANIPYSAFHDPGAVGDCGKYKDLPIPYGSADFDAPEEEQDKIRYLYLLVRPHLSVLKELGAESFSLHISYYADSGVIAYSASELKMIAELECDIPIDLYIQNNILQKCY